MLSSADHNRGESSTGIGTAGLKHAARELFTSVQLIVTFTSMGPDRSRTLKDVVLKSLLPWTDTLVPPSTEPELGNS